MAVTHLNQHLRRYGAKSSDVMYRTCIANQTRIERTLRAARMLSPEQTLETLVQRNTLAGENETLYHLFARATRFLAEAGEPFYGKSASAEYKQRFMRHACRFEVLLDSAILANARSGAKKSVSGCAIPNVNFTTMSQEEIANIATTYHTRGMGTGVCLDKSSKPHEMVLYLNQKAIQEVELERVDRSITNVGVLRIDHPEILQFIRVRIDNPNVKEWKFNTSIAITDAFVEAWTHKTPFTLRDGSVICPEHVMREIATHAHQTGDPSLIFIDRINEGNRLPQLGTYKTVAPSGEVALFEGEACQFAYLNLPRFVSGRSVDTKALKEAVHMTVLMLDNAIEASRKTMPSTQSAMMIDSLRRIGVGVCGLAEMLHAMGLAYDSEEGRRCAENIMSCINYESKRASVDLAQKRGPFPAFSHPATKQELFFTPFTARPTDCVTKADWERLERDFRAHKIRNLSTTILPSTAQSSLIAGITSSIEPPSTLVASDELRDTLASLTQQKGVSIDIDAALVEVALSGSVKKTCLPDAIQRVFRTALEIDPLDHIKMSAAFQRHIDEGISKTVTMPNKASVDDVLQVFADSIHLGLKSSKVYRDGCHRHCSSRE